jgi:tetratricopeptide (TPR) repeat protein
LLDQHKNAQAREQFREAAELDPDDADAAFATGLLLLEAQEYAEAERFLKRALSINPDNDQARLYLGQLAAERKDYDKAINLYRDVTSAQYAFEAQLRIATALAASGEVDAAITQLDALNPGSDHERVQQVLTREQIYRDAKRMQDAMAALNDALAKTPKEQDLLYARALLAAEMKLLEVHERDIRQVLEMDPKNASALNALGYTLADQTDRYAEAVDLIGRALELKPEDPYILDSMGWVNYRLGKNDVALDYLRRALNHRPDAEIAAHLGEVLWVTGDRAGARKVWRDALKRSPDNETLQQTVERFEP